LLEKLQNSVEESQKKTNANHPINVPQTIHPQASRWWYMMLMMRENIKLS